MTYADGQKTPAQLEREVNERRDRVEARIGEIKERLSPGQLVDELLSYSKEGGSKFATNLGAQLTANSLPAALVGVGLAWLIGSSVNASKAAAAPTAYAYRGGDEFPYARLPNGGLRRVSHSADEDGQWWTESRATKAPDTKPRRTLLATALTTSQTRLARSSQGSSTTQAIGCGSSRTSPAMPWMVPWDGPAMRGGTREGVLVSKSMICSTRRPTRRRTQCLERAISATA